MKIKKTLILTLLLLILSVSAYARDSNGQLFHYRLSARADILNFYNHFSPMPLSIGSSDFTTFSLTHDCMFYKSDKLKHGIRVDTGLNYGYAYNWHTTLGVGYHLELGAWYMTMGFKGFLMGDMESLIYSDYTTQQSYYGGLWLETGLVLNLNRKPKGFVLELGVSAVPISVSYSSVISGSGLEMFGPIFLETFDIVLGLGYTF